MEFNLRPWQLSDLENLVKYANNEKIAQFMTDQFDHPFTDASGEAFLRRAMGSSTSVMRAITIGDRSVGGIGLHRQTDIYKNNAELGYWLAEPFWGQGIATNAVGQMVQHGFEQEEMTRIFARPFSNNRASQKVLENNGFTLDARIEGSIVKNGVILDELIYAKRK